MRALCVAGCILAMGSGAFSQEVRLTAMTFFGADEQGTVNPALRWNSFYLDPAWDIGLFEWKDPASVDWPSDLLNDPGDYTIAIPLAAGETRTFGFTVYGGPEVPEGYYGFNLFFDGLESPSPGAPGVSVVAYTDVDSAEPHPAPQAIATAVNTMGWPIADVGGSGTFVYVSAAEGLRVTLTDAAIFAPQAFGVDLIVGQFGGERITSGKDGKPDVIGRFTLRADPIAKPPSDLSCTRSEDGKTTDLSWTNNGTYASLKILRDGVEIASVPVTATSYRDAAAPIGKLTYQVLAEADGVQGVRAAWSWTPRTARCGSPPSLSSARATRAASIPPSAGTRSTWIRPGTSPSSRERRLPTSRSRGSTRRPTTA